MPVRSRPGVMPSSSSSTSLGVAASTTGRSACELIDHAVGWLLRVEPGVPVEAEVVLEGQRVREQVGRAAPPAEAVPAVDALAVDVARVVAAQRERDLHAAARRSPRSAGCGSARGRCPRATHAVGEAVAHLVLLEDREAAQVGEELEVARTHAGGVEASRGRAAPRRRRARAGGAAGAPGSGAASRRRPAHAAARPRALTSLRAVETCHLERADLAPRHRRPASAPARRVAPGSERLIAPPRRAGGCEGGGMREAPVSRSQTRHRPFARARDRACARRARRARPPAACGPRARAPSPPPRHTRTSWSNEDESRRAPSGVTARPQTVSAMAAAARRARGPPRPTAGSWRRASRRRAGCRRATRRATPPCPRGPRASGRRCRSAAPRARRGAARRERRAVRAERERRRRDPRGRGSARVACAALGVAQLHRAVGEADRERAAVGRPVDRVGAARERDARGVRSGCARTSSTLTLPSSEASASRSPSGDHAASLIACSCSSLTAKRATPATRIDHADGAVVLHHGDLAPRVGAERRDGEVPALEHAHQRTAARVEECGPARRSRRWRACARRATTTPTPPRRCGRGSRRPARRSRRRRAAPCDRARTKPRAGRRARCAPRRCRPRGPAPPSARGPSPRSQQRTLRSCEQLTSAAPVGREVDGVRHVLVAEQHEPRLAAREIEDADAAVVARAREPLAVGREDEVLHEVGVALERAAQAPRRAVEEPHPAVARARREEAAARRPARRPDRSAARLELRQELAAPGLPQADAAVVPARDQTLPVGRPGRGPHAVVVPGQHVQERGVGRAPDAHRAVFGGRGEPVAGG